MYEHYSLYKEVLENKNQDHHLKLSENYIENTSDFIWVKKNKTYVEYK